MASVARKGWHRVKSSLADEVEARVAEQLRRQTTDVLEELARLRAQIDSQTVALAELHDMITVQIESTELLGRLLQSARARLDVLEGAAQSSA